MARWNYLSEEDYFMGVALLAAELDKESKSGACIVDNKKRVIGIGFADKTNAVANAILNMNVMDASGMTMYVTHFPCSKSAQLIIQSGIKEIVYKPYEGVETYEIKAAKTMFDGGDGIIPPEVDLKEKLVEYRQFVLKAKKIAIQLN